MKTKEIHLRDPFVLLHDGVYYLYGTRGSGADGFDVYKSADLENWSAPTEVFAKSDAFWGQADFWAPEVHLYRGKFYMFASFKADGICRGTAILVSDTPDGAFRVHNPRATPADWECLDGTLYVEEGTPYMIFCHEWLQVQNGEMCAVRLTEDLSATVGEPFLLWRAGDASWVSSAREEDGFYVTDGPFLYRDAQGALKSLWSSFSHNRYVLATATAVDGSVRGNWRVDADFVFATDGGHGMIFETKDGKKKLALHTPNHSPLERPAFFDVENDLGGDI